MNPNFFKPVPRRTRERNQERAAGIVSPARIRGGLVKYWAPDCALPGCTHNPHVRPLRLPTNAHLGLCRVCGDLQKTEGKIPDFHRPCYANWFDTPEAKNFFSLIRRRQKASLPPYPTRQGRPPTNESLKRFYSWAVLYCSEKKSCRQIAKENGEDPTFVSRDHQLVTRRWWGQIKWLRSAYTRLSSEKQVRALAV